MQENTVRSIFVVIGLVLIVLSVSYCHKVHADCDAERGVVVKNYADMPTCIEKGEH